MALEARLAAERETTSEAGPDTAPDSIVSPVVSLTARRLAALPPDPRPLPSVAAYDQLLRYTRSSAGRPTR